VVPVASRLFEIAFQLAGRVSASFGNMFASASDRMRQLNQRTTSLRNDLRNLERAQRAGTIRAEEYAREFARLTRELQRAEQAQQRYARAVSAAQRVNNFRNQSRANMMDAAAMAVTLGAPVVAAMKFESAMADVRKVVDFDTPEQFKGMEQDILNMSKRIPMAANGLAQIVAAGGQAGIARNELTAYAEAAAKMGVAFDISAEDAGQMMAEWRSAFKMNQGQVNTLADQINYLGNTTAASAPKISDVVRRIGPLGDVGGAAASQIAALGATMVGAGVAEEVAATGIKNMILSLVAGDAATKSQSEAFQALGMDAKQMASAMQKDAQGAITSVFQAIQKLPKEKQASVLSELFGKESIGAIAPLLTNMDELQKNLNKVGDKTKYAGSMQKEFEARSATSANKLQLLKNQANVLAITTGSILLPPLNDLANKLSGLAERFTSFTEKHPGLTRGLVITAAAALGLGIATTALGYAVSLAISPFVKFYAWATRIQLGTKLAAAGTKVWTAAQRALNFAMNMNPILKVVLLIGTLIAIGVTLYKNFDSVRNTVDNLWTSFKTTFPGAAEFIEMVGGKVGELWDKLKGFWRWLTGSGGGSEGGGAPASEGMDTYATGGFANRPSIFAEAGPEAAIPLDGSRRSRSLWERTGELIGAGNGGTSIQVTFAPVIHGAGPEIIPVLQEQQRSFMDQFKDVLHQERRVKLA
jgi:TP901 family phage tail tape measure protein